jgi:hypothetical protein
VISSSVKAKDRLEGASNFNSWRARVFNILEKGDLDELVTRVMEEPTSNAGRATYKKRQAKAKRVDGGISSILSSCIATGALK